MLKLHPSTRTLYLGVWGGAKVKQNNRSPGGLRLFWWGKRSAYFCLRRRARSKGVPGAWCLVLGAVDFGIWWWTTDYTDGLRWRSVVGIPPFQI